MTEPSLPTRVVDFICDRILSIEQLALLLLLHGAADQEWTVGRAAAALRIDETLAQGAMRQLASCGIVERCGEDSTSWRYANGADTAELVEELVALYPSARLEIVMLISRCAMERIRTSHVRAFASAFLLKRAKEDK